MYGSASLSAGKTFTNIFRGRNIEGGRLIGMKRAKPNEIYASPAQRYKFRNNVNYIARI
jgi:hypothetical protein